jgi:hypothetical protein
MMEADDDRLRRILRSIPVDDVAFLVRHPLPQWAMQMRRRDERDEAIRSARSFLTGMGARPQARALSKDLSRYLATGWTRRDECEPAAGTYRGVLHRIAVLNNGVSIGPDQIWNVFHYQRGGRT